MKIYGFLAALMIVIPGFAATVDEVTMEDATQIGDKKLVLNGIGTRKVVRFGIPVKVYVGGLYLEKKSSNSAEIINSTAVKKLVMHFVRAVDRDSLVDSFRTGYQNNCQFECDNMGLFTMMKDAIVSVRKDNQIIFTFSGDTVNMESTGPNAKKADLKNPALVKNILAIFINEKSPPTPEFRKALLGL